jgi:hypothetical protein
MVRVVAPGGTVSAYAWNMFDGGFPLDAFRVELSAMGIAVPPQPSAEACRTEVLLHLWATEGLEEIETREIKVQRTFADFEDFWTSCLAANVGHVVASMSAGDVATLKERLRARMTADAAGRITYSAWANAIKGTLPR